MFKRFLQRQFMKVATMVVAAGITLGAFAQNLSAQSSVIIYDDSQCPVTEFAKVPGGSIITTQCGTYKIDDVGTIIQTIDNTHYAGVDRNPSTGDVVGVTSSGTTRVLNNPNQTAVNRVGGARLVEFSGNDLFHANSTGIFVNNQQFTTANTSVATVSPNVFNENYIYYAAGSQLFEQRAGFSASLVASFPASIIAADDFGGDVYVVLNDGTVYVRFENGGNAFIGNTLARKEIEVSGPSTLMGIDAQGRLGNFAITSDVLPVELVDIDAMVVGADADNIKNDVLVTWITATETNNKYFDVELSRNGINFASVGIVEGQGTTTQQTAYKFTIPDQKAGDVYVRLKQVDYDGKSEYLPMVGVEVEEWTHAPVALSVYPNVAQSHGNITVTGEGIERIGLFDTSGRLIQEFNVSTSNDNGKHQLTLPDVATGMYAISAQTKNGVQGLKIAIQ